MNISKLLLSTTLIMMSCSDIYASEEKLGIDDFTYDYLSKYSVDANGALYRTESGNTIYPIYDEQKLYDMKTYLEKDGNITESSSDYSLKQPEYSSPINLIVKSFNDDIYNTTKTYTLTAPKSVVFTNSNALQINIGNIEIQNNLIIPQDTTLDCYNVLLNFKANTNILILGTITNKNQSYINSSYGFLLFQLSYMQSIILGPKAKYVYDYDHTNNDLNNKKPTLISNTYPGTCMLLYPGCKIMTKNIDNNLTEQNPFKYTIFGYNGNLLLNRYITQNDTNKLVGTINNDAHITFPNNMYDNDQDSKIKAEYNLKKAGAEAPYLSFETTSYFPLLYWNSTFHSYQEGCNESKYHFEEPKAPIDFITNNDEPKKYILSLNKSESNFAKYDVKLWNQCKVESGKYSFKEFVNIESNKNEYINSDATEENKNKYIDLDTLEDLFMDGKTYRLQDSEYSFYGLLNNMPHNIYPRITGTKDIIIHDRPNNNFEVNINIDADNFSGKICCVPEITKVTFANNDDYEKYKGKFSKRGFKCTKIMSDGEVSVMETHFCEKVECVTIGMTDYRSNTSQVFNDFFANDYYSNTLDYRDTVNHINFYNNGFGMKWDSNTIKECFKDGDTYNPSGSENPGLLNNIPVNLLENEIKVNLMGNTSLKLHSYKQRDYVIFSGNNSGYTGIVSIPSNIVKIYFRGENSKVKLNIGGRQYTTIDNNTLRVVNEYKNNVKIYLDGEQITDQEELSKILVLDDEKDTIGNINKYNGKGITWNTNNLTSYFRNGSNLLDDFPNIIYANLAGSSNLKINASENILILLGDNTEYTGTMNIPSNITDVYYLDESSKIKNISYNGTQYGPGQEISNLNFYYLSQGISGQGSGGQGSSSPETGEIDIIKGCKHTWDLANGNNILTKSLSNEEIEDKTLILLDSGTTKKCNVVEITGDNRRFKGIIVTTPYVKKVIFGENSFVRTVNINGKPLKYIFKGNTNGIDFNDYKVLEVEKGVKVNMKSNTGAKHFKNENKTLNINVNTINVCKNGSLSFHNGTNLIIGGNQ